jgi:pre-mRNA-splicing factor SPF27
MFFFIQERLKDLKKDIQEVNWSRKNKQTQVGEKLRHLESQWVGLVSKNYEIEQAVVQLEASLPLEQREALKKDTTTAEASDSEASDDDEDDSMDS